MHLIKFHIYSQIVNNYIIYYKTINNKDDDFTIFDGIDYDDDTSTNMVMEKFYEEILKYKVNEHTNPDYIKIYDYDQRDNVKVNDELYCITENGKPKYIGTSLFSLLIELTNLKNIYDTINYNIVNLK